MDYHMTVRRVVSSILLIFSVLFWAQLSVATGRVGVFECPPFVIDNGDGTYSGLSMLLWDHIAKEMEVVSKFLQGV